MEEEKQTILNIWKKAVERYEQRDKKLCKKYHVELKPIEAEEFYTVFQFENGVQFTVPYDENYDDGDYGIGIFLISGGKNKLKCQ